MHSRFTRGQSAPTSCPSLRTTSSSCPPSFASRSLQRSNRVWSGQLGPRSVVTGVGVESSTNVGGGSEVPSGLLQVCYVVCHTNYTHLHLIPCCAKTSTRAVGS